MVDIFKASITTEVPNISENEKRLLHYFLNWVENPGNAERTWSEVKTEVIRIAQRRCEERASQISAAGRASSNRALTVWPLRGCRTKMLGSRTMTNYSLP
jgi:predicted ATP-dependent protease